MIYDGMIDGKTCLFLIFLSFPFHYVFTVLRNDGACYLIGHDNHQTAKDGFQVDSSSNLTLPVPLGQHDTFHLTNPRPRATKMGREAVSMSGCAVTAKSPKGSIFAVNWFGFGFVDLGLRIGMDGNGDGMVGWWFGGLEVWK